MSKIYDYIIEKPKITSPYGYRNDPKTGKRKFHSGLDLISEIGNRRLKAVEDGYVHIVRTGTTGFGNHVWVRYPRINRSLLYAHLDSILVYKGQAVKAGDVIGIEGTSGRSTGVHLHLGMTLIGSNKDLDPDAFVYTPSTKPIYNLVRLLKKVYRGDDVIKVQEKLNSLGFRCDIDGVYGNETFGMVKKYQKSIKIFVDGKVGKNTAHSFGWLYQGK